MIEFENTTIDSPDDFFRKSNLIFHWILAVPLLIFIFLYLEKRDEQWIPLLKDPLTVTILSYFLFPTSIAFLFIGFKAFRDRIQPFKTMSLLQDKMLVFYKAFVVQQLLFGLSSFLSLIGLYLTGNNGFAIFYIIVLFLSSIFRPSASRVCKDLKLKKEDREIVYKKKAFIS
ncbi:MAG: hypothetical protein OEY51_00750 [Cyclobacteriaceae bacterium]|nr:hypothetical protein [Cyclobacteriaceae bacterium]